MAHKGMFTKTIKERGSKIKVVDNHNINSVLDAVGVNLGFYEVNRNELPLEVSEKYPNATGGMCAKTQFLLNTPEGLGVFNRLKAGAIDSFSFAYETMQKEYETMGDTKVRHLREVKLYEYCPVLFPMNEAADMISAKAENDSTTTAPVDKDAVTCHPYPYIIPKAYYDVLTEEQKEAGLGRQIGKVREAFYNDYSRFEEIGDDGESSYKWYSIVDVFEKFLVVESSGSLAYYKVGYEQAEDGMYTFEDKSDWIEGMLEFVAKLIDTEKAAESLPEEDEASLALKADLEALQAEFGIAVEAEPEVKTELPFTSDENEDTWLLEHENILKYINEWEN